MFQISIETIVAFTILVSAVFAVVAFIGSKQDKKFCSQHGDQIQQMKLDIITSQSKLATLEATNQLQMHNIQVQLDNIQRSIDVLGRIDALEATWRSK